MKTHLLFLVLVLFIVPLTPVFASSTSGFEHSILLTIDSSAITEDFENFPVVIRISESMGTNSFDGSIIFDEVGESYLKIAVYFQAMPLNVEVEYWDATQSLAILHTSLPLLVSGHDAKITFAYDGAHVNNTEYVGLIGSDIGRSIWDSDFALVDHMTDLDTSHILDSTLNENDGTKKGANEPIQTTDLLPYSQKFDGVDDVITTLDDATLKPSYCSISMWLNVSAYSTTANKHAEFTNKEYAMYRVFARQDTHKLSVTFKIAGVANNLDAVTVINTNTAYFVTATYDGSRIRIYVNGVLDKTSVALVGTLSHTTDNLFFGKLGANPALNGTLDEVRISSVAHSTAYVLLDFYSQSDSLFDVSTPITDMDFILAFAVLAFVIAIFALTYVLSTKN